MRLFCVGGIESVRPVVSAVEGKGRGKENRLSGHERPTKVHLHKSLSVEEAAIAVRGGQAMVGGGGTSLSSKTFK